MLPLSALLSQTLVALAIDLDNEFERRMPHTTTIGVGAARATSGPWLTSVAMWASCLRYVDDDGITPAELERLARMKTNLDGMRRWRYVVLGDDGKLRPTAMGRTARETWPPVFGAIKERWRERFGGAAIDELRAALGTLVDGLDPALPDYMPILGYGLSTTGALEKVDFGRSERPTNVAVPAADLPLPALLSKVLVSLALAYEARSKLSLAIAANAMRLIDDGGSRVRDLPRRAGVSKEAIAMALGFLERNGYVTRANDPTTSRIKIATPTERGKRARDGYVTILRAIEAEWRERYGTEAIDRLRRVLQDLVEPASGKRSELFACIAPQAENWRSTVASPETLPHFPMVLHRGGFPDGS